MAVEHDTKFLVNGEQFVASSAEALVSQMNEQSFQPCKSAEEYMQEVAERVTMSNGLKPRIDSFDSFVEDLVGDGYVKVAPGAAK